ncbi:DUF6882 domain-containing protein [Mucilaginibacter terrae]|uniref:DUF6882 domain-containing protein n=1 Tax=Mucilaginibacter terrae TaxID=1955052 RepID=UPI00363469FD
MKFLSQIIQLAANIDFSYNKLLSILFCKFVVMNLFKKDFESYASNCVNEISMLQNEFMQLYDINSYGEWYYDHDIGAFQFKADHGKNLYFRYIDVGSFSTNTNTWNWSWDNSTTPRLVKAGLEKVRIFGATNDFGQLTTGLIEGDEYTGWEMTSISAKLLSAIGMYRIQRDHLFIYFIFTHELTQEQYDALENKSVECDVHEKGQIAFVCKHLISKEYPGFHEAFESGLCMEENDDYQAWCDECEKVRINEGKWNEESMAFAEIKIVCDQCYFEIKYRQTL